MAGINKLYKKAYYKQIDTSKPILLVSGDNDPVGEYGKGVRKLNKFYLNTVGVTDVTMKLYEGARHEILNETCKAQVYDDIVAWLDSKVE